MVHELNDQSPKNGPEVPATKQEAADATEVTVEDGVVVIKDVSENLDNVSGLRVTTPRFRRHQAEMLREIMNEGGSVIFIQADLDNLKGFNVVTGSQTLANGGIRYFAETMRQRIKSLVSRTSGAILDFNWYKPFAGGDEFLLMVRVAEAGSTKEIIRLIEAELSQPVEFELGRDKEPWLLTTSVGCHAITGRRTDLIDDPFELLQKLEEESEQRLIEKKSALVLEQLQDTINDGKVNEVDHHQYIWKITEIWGNRRITPEALAILLLHVIARTIRVCISGGYHKK